MVMSSKQRFCTAQFCIADMLDHSPGNCQTIKGAGSSSNLIQDQQTFGGCIPQDIGNLCHLYHKGTLTAGQVIRSPHSGKYPVNNPDGGFLSWNKAANLCHQHDQCSLSHISGFTRHIRAGNNGDPLFMIVQESIIGNKHVIFNHTFHHWMASVFNVNDPIFAYLGAHIIIPFCYKCKRCKNIQGGYSLGSTLDTYHFISNFIPYIRKQLVFQSIKLVLCTKDHIFQIF